MHKIVLYITTVLATMSAAYAQSSQSCDDKPSTATVRQCLNNEIQAAVSSLDKAYIDAAARKHLSQTQTARISKLKLTFEASAKSACLHQAQQQADGTIEPEISANCYLGKINARVAILNGK